MGASGAIFGLFGAMLVVQRHRGGDTRQLWVLILINGVIGFVVPSIAWQAHLGGPSPVPCVPPSLRTRPAARGRACCRPVAWCWFSPC